MQFSTITLSFLAVASAPFVSAVASVVSCSVQHNAFAPGATQFGGNVFTVHVTNVADGSQSSICNALDRELRHSAGSFSSNINGDINEGCASTFMGNDRNSVDLQVGFGQQSAFTQRNALQAGMLEAFGSSGLVFDINTCDISQIPV